MKRSQLHTGWAIFSSLLGPDDIIAPNAPVAPLPAKARQAVCSCLHSAFHLTLLTPLQKQFQRHNASCMTQHLFARDALNAAASRLAQSY